MTAHDHVIIQIKCPDAHLMLRAAVNGVKGFTVQMIIFPNEQCVVLVLDINWHQNGWGITRLFVPPLSVLIRRHHRVYYHDPPDHSQVHPAECGNVPNTQ